MSSRGRTGRVLLSEVVKLVTLRSVWISMVATAVACVGLAAATAPSIGAAIVSGDPSLAEGTVPETVGLEMLGLGLVGIIVIGVTAGSSEYASGQLTTSLSAVPGRVRLVTCKALAVLLVTVVVALVTIPATSLAAQHGLGDLSVVRDGIPGSLWRRWGGAALLWIAVAQIAFALAMLWRQALLPLFVMIVLSQLTLVLVHLFSPMRFLPFPAGVQLYDPTMITSSSPGAAMTPAVALVTLAAWVVVLLGAAAVFFTRRDARR